MKEREHINHVMRRQRRALLKRLPQQSTLIAVPTRQLQVHALQANEHAVAHAYTHTYMNTHVCTHAYRHTALDIGVSRNLLQTLPTSMTDKQTSLTDITEVLYITYISRIRTYIRTSFPTKREHTTKCSTLQRTFIHSSGGMLTGLATFATTWRNTCGNIDNKRQMARNECTGHKNSTVDFLKPLQEVSK